MLPNVDDESPGECESQHAHQEDHQTGDGYHVRDCIEDHPFDDGLGDDDHALGFHS